MVPGVSVLAFPAVVARTFFSVLSGPLFKDTTLGRDVDVRGEATIGPTKREEN